MALMLFRAFLLLAVCVCSNAFAAVDKNNHVVLISLDGFPAWMWRDPVLTVVKLGGAVAGAPRR